MITLLPLYVLAVLLFIAGAVSEDDSPASGYLDRLLRVRYGSRARGALL